MKRLINVHAKVFALWSIALLFTGCISHAQAIKFTTEHHSDAEQEAVELIKSLNKAHDLSKWQFSDEIHIDEKAIPHSHPILTLHTRHNNPEAVDLLLSTYLHENIHRYLDNHPAALADIIIALKKRFPKITAGYPEGARNEYSNYLHMVVCFLELEAIQQLLSNARYQKVVAFWQRDHYTEIYKLVIEHNDEMAALIKQHKLLL